MLIDDIKARIMQAMKAGNTIEKDILRLAVGEVQTAAARGAADLTDEGVSAIVRKLIKSDEETLALTTDSDRKETLGKEIVVLKSLLPQGLDVEAIMTALVPVREAIRAASSDGQATGIAMKHLKPSGVTASGKDVSEAVRRMRMPSA